MRDTCSKTCMLWKKHKDSCPNYVIGYWREGDKEMRIEDCAPKRILEQLKVLHNLVIGLQQTSNQERDASNGLANVMFEVVKKAQEGRVMIGGINTEKSDLS